MKMKMAGNFDEVDNLIKRFPHLKKSFMSSISYQAKELLYNQYLKGKAINLRGKRKDKRGRFLVSSKFVRGDKIKVASYPLNLFENGRILRDGKKESGKKVMTKLRSFIRSRSSNFSDKAYSRSFQKEFGAQ